MNDVNESTLIAFIYGELGQEENKRIERLIANDPELAAKVNELQGVRTLMGKLNDAEPPSPIIFHETDPSVLGKWMPWLAAAAAVCLVVLLAFLTDTSVTVNNRGLTVVFGQESETASKSTEQEILPLLQSALREQEKTYLQRLQVVQSELESQINPGNTYPDKSASEIKNLENYLNQYRQQQKAEIAAILEQNIQIQQNELRTILAEYHQILEERRLQDLKLIEAGFQAMQDNVNQQKSETDEILANILTTANNTNY